jgi:polyphosphate kinase
MTERTIRNLFRRVEVAFPVLDGVLKKRIIMEGLNPYLKDNTDAWELSGDGRYQRRKPHGKQAAFSAQRHLAQTLGASGTRK